MIDSVVDLVEENVDLGGSQFSESIVERWYCGEVEDVAGALTPVFRGVAQVFHELLVELRLLLVAEMEERERKTDRRKARK